MKISTQFNSKFQAFKFHEAPIDFIINSIFLSHYILVMIQRINFEWIIRYSNIYNEFHNKILHKSEWSLCK